MKAPADRDVLFALSDALDRRADADQLREACERAQGSRFARLRAAWTALTAAVLGRGATEFPGRPRTSGGVRISALSSWRSAKNAPREYVEYLQARLSARRPSLGPPNATRP